MRTSLSLALGLAASAVLAMPAHAQNSGSINAKANVLAAITVTGTDLDFGNVAQSQTKVIAPDAATAGKFTIVGLNGAPVVMNFSSLPANVNNAGLPLSAWQKMQNSANTTGSLSATPITVGSAFNGTLSGTGNNYVWVGATLSAGAAVAPGTYTSSTPITLQVVYQ
jgi:hypothetical protein